LKLYQKENKGKKEGRKKTCRFCDEFLEFKDWYDNRRFGV